MQAAVTSDLGLALGDAAVRAARLAQLAFDTNERLFPSNTSNEVFDSIAVLAAAVDSTSFADAMSAHRELLAGPQVDSLRPFSPMDVGRPESPYEEQEISQSLHLSLAEEPESSSPRSPPHKRARSSATSLSASRLLDEQVPVRKSARQPKPKKK